MKKRFRNPVTGEILILEEVEMSPGGSGASASEESGEASTLKDSSRKSRSPFDFLDEIDGKDVEKVAMGAVLGIGGMLALRGLFSFIARD